MYGRRRSGRAREYSARRPGHTALWLAAAVAALALVAGPVTGLGPAAGAASPGATAPTGAPSYQLAGVSCVSPTFCMSVGSSAFRSGGVDNSSNTLIERWNGKTWSILASPGGTGATLYGVSCTSTTFCIAVGSVVERWNGTKWSIVTSPTAAGGLNAVSCTSTTFCIAVGNVVERWNGTKWSIVTSPSDPGGNSRVLADVSCTTAAKCFAVGFTNAGGVGRPAALTQSWNGTKWSIVASPAPSRAYTAFSGVSCTNPTNCTAVGYSQTASSRFNFGPPKTLVERWNGKRWSIVTSPNPGTTNSRLTAVSCATPTSCVAVGQSTSAADRTSALKTLVEGWNGTAWSNITSPNPAGSTVSGAADVSCAGTKSCVAVGRYTTTTGPRAVDAGPFKTLIQKSNGTTWSIATSPDPPAPRSAH